MLGTCFKFVTEIKHELFFCTDPNFERRITTGNGTELFHQFSCEEWTVSFSRRVKRKPRRILNWLHPVVHYKVVPSVRLSTRSSSVMPWVLWPHASYFLITCSPWLCRIAVLTHRGHPAATASDATARGHKRPSFERPENISLIENGAEVQKKLTLNVRLAKFTSRFFAFIHVFLQLVDRAEVYNI